MIMQNVMTKLKRGFWKKQRTHVERRIPMASIHSSLPKNSPQIFCVIATNRQAAERLGRLHMSGVLCAPSRGEREATITRYLRMPERMQEVYHVFALNMMNTHDGPIVLHCARVVICG